MARRIDDMPLVGRQIPMKVLCLGHLRTGTISLDLALKQLGYSPYHGKALLDETKIKSHLPLWVEALKLRLSPERDSSKRPYDREDFDKFLSEYDCLLEPPFLFESMLEAYPEAKVIVTMRSTESWLDSMRRSVWAITGWPWESVVHVDPEMAVGWWEYVKFVGWLVCGDKWIPNGLAKADSEISSGETTKDAELEAARTYEQHYANVRGLVPKERMLEWNPAEGWQPLCDFLGVGVPMDDDGRVADFPRSNDAAEFVGFYKTWFAALKAEADKRGI